MTRKVEANRVVVKALPQVRIVGSHVAVLEGNIFRLKALENLLKFFFEADWR